MSFYLGVRHIPELIMCPVEFDFPWKARSKQQYYIGSLVDLNRKDTLVDKRYLSTMQNITSLKAASNDHSYKLVYCSLGTLAGQHYKKYPLFLDKVVNAFGKNPNWTLIVGLGIETDLSEVKGLPSNVHFFSKVPQLELLKQCDAMITHGGMNSIKECLLLGVPMIVYPLNDHWDQNGNSARVVYHGLGVRGNIRKDSIHDIYQKTEKILTTPSFKENVLKMSDIFHKYNESEEVVAVIKSFLNTRVTSTDGLVPEFD